MFNLFQEILTKKNNWLRLRWLRQRQAEPETETAHILSHFHKVNFYLLSEETETYIVY